MSEEVCLKSDEAWGGGKRARRESQPRGRVPGWLFLHLAVEVSRPVIFGKVQGRYRISIWVVWTSSVVS